MNLYLVPWLIRRTMIRTWRYELEHNPRHHIDVIRQHCMYDVVPFDCCRNLHRACPELITNQPTITTSTYEPRPTNHRTGCFELQQEPSSGESRRQEWRRRRPDVSRPSAIPPTSCGAMSGVRTLTWKADYDLIDSLTKVRFLLLAPHAVSPVVSHPACSLSALESRRSCNLLLL